MAQMIQASTKDVRLFSAIAAMGIPWTEESGSVAGGERVWLFGDVSDCGNWKLSDLLAWWRDKTFHRMHPANPFNVVKCTMGSDKGLRECTKRNGSIFQRKAGKSYVTESSPDMPIYGQSVRAIDSIPFAAALSGVGFKVSPAKPVGDWMIFKIGEKSDTMDITFTQAQQWWNDKTFEERNGQHPFAYAKAVAITYSSAVEAMKKDRELVKWRPKGGVGTAFIHPDCSSKTEEQVSGWFKGK
jgi:hypothetical protein